MTFFVGLACLIAALLALVYLFLILPRLWGGADLELLRTDYAHRGLWREGIPENSMAAFALALRAKKGIELDVRLSRDGQIVVFHDDSLKRMCGVDRRVEELTLAQLKRLRLADSDSTVPTLEEVLRLVRGRVPLMIEIKGERPNASLCRRLCTLLDGYDGPFSVISFSPLILRWFKQYRPSYARGQLVTRIQRHERPGSRAVNFLLSHMLLNCLSRPDFLSVNHRYRRRPVFLLCLRVLRVTGFAWTPKTAKERRDCRRLGYFTVFELPNQKKKNDT